MKRTKLNKQTFSICPFNHQKNVVVVVVVVHGNVVVVVHSTLSLLAYLGYYSSYSTSCTPPYHLVPSYHSLFNSTRATSKKKEHNSIDYLVALKSKNIC